MKPCREEYGMGDRPDFPTMAEVQSADAEQLARWYLAGLIGFCPDDV